MSDQPWETHDHLCSRRHPQVAYPRRACPECRAVEAARAEGYAAGLIEGDKGGRIEGERIGIQKTLIAWKEAEPLHDAEVRADEREKAIERVEAWLDRDEWGEAEFVRSAVIDALRGESNG